MPLRNCVDGLKWFFEVTRIKIEKTTFIFCKQRKTKSRTSQDTEKSLFWLPVCSLASWQMWEHHSFMTMSHIETFFITKKVTDVFVFMLSFSWVWKFTSIHFRRQRGKYEPTTLAPQQLKPLGDDRLTCHILRADMSSHDRPSFAWHFSSSDTLCQIIVCCWKPEKS